jgi:alanine racemase
VSRPACIRIDLPALRHNHQHLRATHGGRLLAVLKADAYGHGAVACAQALAGVADGFAVAFGDEASVLRAAGITQPVLVLEGVFTPAELRCAVAEGWWIVVHHEAQLAMIEGCTLRDARLHVWLKVDSGMHRCGFAPEAVAAAHARLRASGQVASITLMSHLARADEAGHDFTHLQLMRFEQATAGLPGARSLANSAGMLFWPAARRDWGRGGIGLYGVDPAGGSAAALGLQAVMSAESAIMAVREIDAGEPLGYGGAFVATRKTRVGLVAFGYADGYPRAAREGTPVAVDGHEVRLIGRVSMDMLTVDLTDVPTAGVGSRVELWGRQVGVNVVAGHAGTIAYEVLCNAKRARRVHVA